MNISKAKTIVLKHQYQTTKQTTITTVEISKVWNQSNIQAQRHIFIVNKITGKTN